MLETLGPYHDGKQNILYIRIYSFFASMTMTRITQTSIYPPLTMCLTIAGLDASVGFNFTVCVFVIGLILLCHQQYTKIYHWLRSIESLEVCLFLRISMFLRTKLYIVYIYVLASHDMFYLLWYSGRNI